jgi:hypothetical protein
LPLLCDFDDVVISAWALVTESEVLGVLNQLRYVVVVRGVDHVEEEDAIGQVRLGALLREELGQLRLLHHVADEVHDAELVVLGHLYGAQLGVRDEVLPPGEDLLEEVLGDLLGRRQVILH